MDGRAWLLGLFVLGVLGIHAHPWGLAAALAGLLLYLWSGVDRREPIAGLRPPGPGWHWLLYGLGLCVALGASLQLFLLFSAPGILGSTPPWVWPKAAALAGLALAGGLSAALALPLAEPPQPQRRIAPRELKGSAGQSGAFWAACLGIPLILGTAPWISALLLPCLFLFAPALPGEGRDRLPGNWRLAALAVLALGLGLRLWELPNLPQGLNGEAAYTLSIAGPVIEGKEQAFVWATGGFSGVTLYHHAVGWVYRLLGAEATAVPLRLITVCGWVVLAAYTTLFAATAFSWKTALACAAYLGLAFFPLHYSRMGFYYIWAPAVGAAVLAHGLWSLRSLRANLHLALAGAWCAAAGYAWTAGFVSPGLAAAVMLPALALDRGRWLSRLPGLLCATVLFLALSVPGILTFVHFPGGAAHYSAGASGSVFAANAPPKTTLTSNLMLHLDEMLVSGTPPMDTGFPGRAAHYLPGTPLLRGSLLFFVLAGFGIVARRPAGGRGAAVLAALLLGFLPAWLSNPLGRNWGRQVMLMLPFALLFGLGCSALLRDLGAFLGRVQARIASALTGLALALILTSEARLYFHDYQGNLEAVSANFGASAVLARAATLALAPDEPVFFGERFAEASSFTLLLPRRAQGVFLREAPDLIKLAALHPRGTLVTGSLLEDWIPWLQDHEGGSTFLPVPNPWQPADVAIEESLIRIRKRYLGGIFRWAQPYRAGLRRASPDAWEGRIWVARPGDYLLSSTRGRLSLDGLPELAPAVQGRFRLQSVPYAVRVTGSPEEPILTVLVQGARPDIEWTNPVFPQSSPHGLRQTLRHHDSGAAAPAWVSLRPVLAQRFDTWSRAADISVAQLPLRGSWDGSLRVPQDGDYRFLVPNNISGNVTLSIGGKLHYHSRGGSGAAAALALKASHNYPLLIEVDILQAMESLRFVVEAPGAEEPQAVPYPWLLPAPLPRAERLPDRAG